MVCVATWDTVSTPDVAAVVVKSTMSSMTSNADVVEVETSRFNARSVPVEGPMMLLSAY